MQPQPSTRRVVRPLMKVGLALCAGTLALGGALLPTTASAQLQLSAGFHGPRVAVSGPVFHVAGRYRGGRGPGWRHGGHGHGHAWGGLALGLGLGALFLARPWEPVVVDQRPTYIYTDPPQTAPAPVPPVAPGQVYSTRPAEPVIYPAQGQSAAQTEADRIDCNRWATTQQSAMADANVFHRATQACLEGRGYTVR